MAGLGHRVPKFSVCSLLILALAGVGGCGTKHADYPWAKNTGTLKSPDSAPSVQVQPTTEAATAPAPEIVAVTPPMPASPPPAIPAPTPPAASEPAAPFLPEPVTKTQTSNGGDLLAPPQTIIVEEPKHTPIQISATGLYMYGSVNGNVQIPRGGVKGTSNANRPHFDSVGISYANIGDGELGVRLSEHGEAFVGAQIIQLSGAEFLGVQSLTTDGVVFPAHARVGSNIKLDWYRLGYRYTIPISFAENGTPDLTFTPWASLIALDFAYHLTAPKVAAASRNFTKPGVQIGAIFAWRPRGGPLSLEAAIGGFPTMNNLPTISVESLYARYHFYEWHRFDFTGLLGIAWEQQEYRDDKPLPNQVSANFGPLLMVGAQVKF
jgi:hypothetical protein